MPFAVVSHPRELGLPASRLVVALGVFDGMHMGHQAIFRALREMALRKNAFPVALFFSPHPRALLNPPGPLALMPEKLKLETLAGAGILQVVSMPFSRELSQWEPEEFLERTFCWEGETAAGFCVGENWHFGRGNTGDAVALRRWGERNDAEVQIIPSVQWRGETVSSSRIREAIRLGRLDEAETMMGRPVTVSGWVEHGWRKGHDSTHFPTANLSGEGMQLPPDGVYAAEAAWEGESSLLPGVVYVGMAPTIRKDVQVRLVELHLFQTPVQELYGRYLQVRFRKFLRESREFSDEVALRSQIALDVAAAHAVLHVSGEETFREN